MKDQVVVFDMDGVLVDVTGSYRETIRRTVEHFTGQQISYEFIQDYKNQGGWNNDWELAERIISDLGREGPYNAVVSYFQSILLGNGSNGLILREKWIAEPGVLERLHGRYQFALFTGRLREEAQMTLDRFAPHLTFDPIVGTDDIREGKPAPDGLLKIAALTPGKKLWYVGDAVDDARSAKAAGVLFIGIAAPSNPRREELVRLLELENAVAVLEDINQLESAIDLAANERK